jgi:ATP synthase protein I
MSGPDDQTIRGAGTVKPPVHRVFVAQFIVLFVVSGLAACYRYEWALSLLLGGLIHLLPSIYFARQVFKFSGASAAHRVTQSFYRGEMGKFILTATGFALVFSLVERLSPAALFAGFGLMIVSHALFVAWLNQ